MSITTKGQRGFNTNWTKQSSGNLKRVFDDSGIKIILRERSGQYEVHAWNLDSTVHVCATKLNGPTMIYWRRVNDDITPVRLDLRSAKRLIDRQFDQLIQQIGG